MQGDFGTRARRGRVAGMLLSGALGIAVLPAAAEAGLVTPHAVKPQTVTPQVVGGAPAPPPPLQASGSGPGEPIQNRAPTAPPAPPAPSAPRPDPPRSYPTPKEADMPGAPFPDFPGRYLPDHRDKDCGTRCKAVWQRWFDQQAFRVANEAKEKGEPVPLSAVTLLIWSQVVYAQIKAIDDWIRADPAARGPAPSGTFAPGEEEPDPGASKGFRDTVGKLGEKVVDLAGDIVDYIFSDSDQQGCGQPLPGEERNSTCLQ